jgi:hypothetical protein
VAAVSTITILFKAGCWVHDCAPVLSIASNATLPLGRTVEFGFSYGNIHSRVVAFFILPVFKETPAEFVLLYADTMVEPLLRRTIFP